LDMGFVQAVILRHEKHGPIPEVLLAIVLAQPIRVLPASV